MKRQTTIEMPTVLPKGKTLKLVLDFEAGEVEIVLPVSFKTPRVDHADLEQAVALMADLADGEDSRLS